MAWSILQLTILIALSNPTAEPPATKEQKADRAGEQAPPSMGLRIARSEDGLRFTESPELFLRNARSPSLVSLPNGDLLALFEHPGAKSGTAALTASRSKDGGKTWLPAKPIRLTGLPEGPALASPTLVVMPSGLVRMYFSLPEAADRKQAKAAAIICSAVTRDGVEYQLDHQVRVHCEGIDSARLSAFWTEKQLVLLVAADDKSVPQANSGRAVAQQYISSDGRTFAKPERARFAGDIGQVLRVDRHHWRMYVAVDSEIRSRMSNDGTRWRDESSECLRGGMEPTVCAAGDKKFVMLFSAPLSTETAKLPELAAGAPPDAARPDAAQTAQAGDQANHAAGPPPSGTGGKSTPGPDQPGAAWNAFASEGYEAELGADWSPSGGLTDSSTADSGLAPLPDFRNKVDYINWFIDNGIVPDNENAYFSYQPVLEGILTREDKINDMFNDPEPGLVPGPWNPSDRPLWEESYQATQDLMWQYFQAARDPRSFSSPARFSSDSNPEDRLLFEYMLPALATMRAACKATLAQAWRAPDGSVPPDQMRSALETVLGNARHLAEGPTLIERLVSTAERNMAHQNARRALQQGVFNSAADLAATLDVLRDKDAADSDPAGWVRLEHAGAMDVMQYFFQAKEPGGEPEFRADRLPRFTSILGGQPIQDEGGMEALAKMTADDAKAEVEAMTEYYEQTLDHFRNEFPYASADHLETLAIETGKDHLIARMLLPSLAGRAKS